MKILVAVLALVVGGCTFLGPVKDASRYYTLAPRPMPAARAGGPLVALMPVELPAYLDRNEVAVRVSDTELRYVPTERWAEPLEQNVTRVLSQNLGAALGSDRVVSPATSIGLVPAPDFWIEVIVVRFESTTDGTAHLTARWAVRDGARKVQRIRQSQHEHQAAASTEGGVQALSATLGDLADEIADVVKELAGSRS
jgi:uncharacterized lipoprotein YmbA